MTTMPPHQTRAVLTVVVLLVHTLVSTHPVHAQTATARGPKAYIELLGNGLVISANYEHPLANRLDVRVGAGGLWLDGVQYVLGFGMVGWELRPGTHALHVSVGAGVIRFENVFFLESLPATAGYGTAAVAYRYQPHRRGLFLQLAFTPVLAESTFSPWGGFAVGFAY